MKYLPKSKLGATVSALYLLIVFLLLLIIGTNDTGGHANPLVLVVGLVFILTLPLSVVYVWIVDVLGVESTNKTVESVTTLVVFGVSAVFNAAVIYFAFGFLSRGLKAIFAGRLK
jgi:hypothetical protein